MPSDIDQLSYEEILELRERGPKLHPDSNIVKLTPSTVSKASQDSDEDAADASEANTLDLVFAETTIPVPRVRRVVKRQWDFLIVMDHIPGPTLAHVWPTLSTWRKICVAFTLRRYVRQLRRLKASATTPPGPLSAQGARICESPSLVKFNLSAVHSPRILSSQPFSTSASRWRWTPKNCLQMTPRGTIYSTIPNRSF